MKALPIIRQCVLMLIPALAIIASSVTRAVELPSVLVDTGWLAEHQGEVIVLDVRQEPATFVGQPPKTGTKPGAKPSLKRIIGHIPGAVPVPWKQVVTKSSQDGATLKAMLPAAETITELMRRSGVDSDSTLVIAGLGRNAKDQALAARLYFTLKVFGHEKVALLDGGTAQWLIEKRPLAFTPGPAPARGDFSVTGIDRGVIADTRAVEDAIANGGMQLVDCRTEDRFLGLSEKKGFVDPVHRGHLPGARTLPFVLVGDNHGPARLLTPEQIRDLAALKGIDLTAPTIAYCDAGIAASLVWFALHELIGNDQVSLYDGSMHAWSKLAGDHPVVALAQMAEQQTLAESPPATSDESQLAPKPEPAPTPTLQTLVDRRRDALRERREHRLDTLSGRRHFQPAWIAARETMHDGYRDSVRQAQRHHRDTLRLYRDTYADAVAPWTRQWRDWNETRHFLMQMDQLDREEYLDQLRFGYAYLPW